MPKQALESCNRSLFTYEIKIFELEFEFNLASSFKVKSRDYFGMYCDTPSSV